MLRAVENINSLILISRRDILQGTGVTPLKYGETYDMDFVVNSMENRHLSNL